MESFTINVSSESIDDLRRRLDQTRVIPKFLGANWEGGMEEGFARELLDFWRESYDWRALEAALNSQPQFVDVIQDSRVHFLHFRSSNPQALPIVLAHGWPYSFLEMLPLARELEDFHVVVPSLPGYGFSDLPKDQDWSDPVIGSILHELMTRTLGYSRFLVYGEDVGSAPTEWIAANHPESTVGLFSTHTPLPNDQRLENLTTAEKEFRAVLASRWFREDAYSQLQSTKPDTVALALNDSPVGLLAWIVEKLNGWRGTSSNVLEDWTVVEILNLVSLYWFSQSIGSSFAAYFHHRRKDETPRIQVPVGALVQHNESGFPLSYLQRTCSDVRMFEEMVDGGHFTAKQRPAEVAAGLRRFVRML